MAVEVRIPTIFRKYTDGKSSVDLEPGTVAGIVEQLEALYPGIRGQILTEEGRLHRFVNVYVNDEDARYLDSLETKVDEGDIVSLLPSVAGGCSRCGR